MKRVLKWIGIVLLGILLLLLLAGATLYALSTRKLSRTNDVPAEPALTITSDSATIARGAYLTKLRIVGRLFLGAGVFPLQADTTPKLPLPCQVARRSVDRMHHRHRTSLQAASGNGAREISCAPCVRESGLTAVVSKS